MPSCSGGTFRRQLLPLDSSCASSMPVPKVTSTRCSRPLYDSGPTLSLVGNDVFFTNRRGQIVTLAARHAVPTIYAFRSFAESGGLMSYSTSLVEVYRQIGLYAGRILRGAKPADLPAVQPTKFELVINLRTAKVLGVNIS